LLFIGSVKGVVIVNSAESVRKHKELAREIDIYHEADVVVVGGGPGD
jgi:hypothetical protein